ncbi:Aste57867_17182 [Aphanomyces stellatus]|uniref:Aste57867_17182 protein n=1 Tax=Aphanomyces stellatus TaxID=120398 RepID=A0A485LAS6_9STRA|nr:hypothetical protein As57867_017123 [Aphanomyces stellatus]VFT93939.1 Aste57867_17182 [Aphanomyces stellatus]
MQFGQMDPFSPVTLYRLAILDPTQVEFTFFAWTYLLDWTIGLRDVISLQGDNGTMTLLSDYLAPLHTPVSVAEFPTTLAFYQRNVVLYITGAMIALATLLLVYIGLCQGNIEAWNILELQRVGAIVWIGRPLLFVRSLTAVALLSTATLELVTVNSISYFHATQLPWYTTILGANEVTWIVAIVNDIAMAITRNFTFYFAAANSAVVWLVVVALSFNSPLHHGVTIDMQCHAVQVDFQIACSSGIVTIGYLSRMVTILGVVGGSNVFCYTIARLVLRRRLSTSAMDSIFLYAGARYLFLSAKWRHRDVYYMDRMSAVMNGILSVRIHNVMYCLDVKLWRTIHFDLASGLTPTGSFTDAANHAVPHRVHD